ncbi:nitroreductase family protein [Nocardia otitidiscaviarum]|uniref:Acg family FMN-binding oxidoreductase n=1 Tax=Nocardia otitidiscaviarum TaxID=1823 RepID=UPI0004A6E3FC|nr:nitroreductase family protein [Nocardia otitidiscaviarum]MBF6488360.1 nitroreductase family protein [Nocardia otitidiscaviarum]
MTVLPTGVTIEKAVLLAGRAPSLHNSQPWRWTFDGAALRLFAVPERLLPATDPHRRQLLISCGVTLDHLRVAMAAAGWRCTVARFPDPNNHDHLATVVFRPAAIVTDADRERADAIARRRTDRLPFAAPTGWDELEAVLRTVVDPEDAVVSVLGPESRARLAHASGLTAAVRRYDAEYQAELRWWTGHSAAAGGVPRTALANPEEQARVGIGRAFPAAATASRRAELDTDHAVVLVLSTVGDRPEELLRCGTALSTVLLECTVAGSATCPLTHLTEDPRGRAVVRELTGRDDLPQVLVRVGTAPEPESETVSETETVTPRRPLADILAMPR